MLAGVLPRRCDLKPSPDSDIEMEVWLPVENWNGKFQAVGNGGWAGVISYPAMAAALQEGYATASTDTGHKGGNALLRARPSGEVRRLRLPRRARDDGEGQSHHRRVLRSRAAPVVLERLLDRRTAGSDGSPALSRRLRRDSRRRPGQLPDPSARLGPGVAIPTLKDPASAVPAAKLAMLNKAVLDACDTLDGVKDGLLNDPRNCHFDRHAPVQGRRRRPCLTAPQVETVKRMYAPAKTKSGDLIFPGKEPGSETGWNVVSGGPQPPGVSVGSFQVAYNDANWDWKTFDLDRDLKLVDEKVGSIVNAINPDLSAFKARGGKLLHVSRLERHGDFARQHHQLLHERAGEDGTEAGQLRAAVHGAGHAALRRRSRPDQFNYMAALERWRESNTAPDQFIASRVTNNRVDMTRPLCPYPQVAEYKGVGSTNDAANFVCKAPAKVNGRISELPRAQRPQSRPQERSNSLVLLVFSVVQDSRLFEGDVHSSARPIRLSSDASSRPVCCSKRAPARARPDRDVGGRRSASRSAARPA